MKLNLSQQRAAALVGFISSSLASFPEVSVIKWAKISRPFQMRVPRKNVQSILFPVLGIKDS